MRSNRGARVVKRPDSLTLRTVAPARRSALAMIRLREYWGSKWPKCTTFTPSSTRGVPALTGSVVNRWPDPLEELMHGQTLREALQLPSPRTAARFLAATRS